MCERCGHYPEDRVYTPEDFEDGECNCLCHVTGYPKAW